MFQRSKMKPQIEPSEVEMGNLPDEKFKVK